MRSSQVLREVGEHTLTRDYSVFDYVTFRLTCITSPSPSRHGIRLFGYLPTRAGA